MAVTAVGPCPISLTALADRYGSDKGDQHRDQHGYTHLYDLLLGPLRHQPITLLEIGLASGGPETSCGHLERRVDSPSLSMWLDYFSSAQIVGFDISDFSHIHHDRFTFVRGDAGEPTDLEDLVQRCAGFDVIIDDGSHASYHQQLCLKHLWPHLKPGGLYIVEDLHWQSPVYEGALPAVPLTADLFAALERGARFDTGLFRPDEMEALRREVASFGVFRDYRGRGEVPKLLVLRKQQAASASAHAVGQLEDAAADNGRPRVRSFDLFDTLVARRCVWPTAIFRIMERRLGIPGFATWRIEAEQAVLHGDYGLHDIYVRLAEDRPELAEMIASIEELELALEFQQLFPIAEQVRQVSPGDIIVSDMYLPYEFLQMVVQEILGLKDVWLFVTPHGKGRGEVWVPLQRHFAIIEHTGDNSVSDLKSPAYFGIPGRLTRSWEPTSLEKGVRDAGLPHLSGAMREARLRQWSWHRDERDLQLLQAGVNAPMLLIATILLLRAARQAGAEQILASGRDCYLWLKIIERLQEEFVPGIATHYFWTGRVPRTYPSDSYKSYVRRLIGDKNSLIVDVCGTGYSLKTLCETLHISKAQPLLIYRMRDVRVHARNPALAPHEKEVEVLSLLDPAFQFDNIPVELANPAPHPTVFDVVQENGIDCRISPDWPAEPISARFGAVQEQAFTAALEPLLARPIIDELAHAPSDLLATVLATLYGSFGTFGATLGTMMPEFLFENARVNTALAEMDACQLALEAQAAE